MRRDARAPLRLAFRAWLRSVLALAVVFAGLAAAPFHVHDVRADAPLSIAPGVDGRSGDPAVRSSRSDGAVVASSSDARRRSPSSIRADLLALPPLGAPHLRIATADEADAPLRHATVAPPWRPAPPPVARAPPA